MSWKPLLQSLSPGLVNTDMAGVAVMKGKVPALEPEEVAQAVLYVLSTPPHVNVSICLSQLIL